MTISNGSTLTNTGISYIGRGHNSLAILTVDGTGSTWTNTSTGEVNIGRWSEVGGTLIVQNGGTVNLSGQLNVGGWTVTSVGALNVTGAGSKLTTDNKDIWIGYRGAGTVTVSEGGEIDTGTGHIDMSVLADSSGGTLNIGAGTGAGILSTTAVNGGLSTATINFNSPPQFYGRKPVDEVVPRSS